MVANGEEAAILAASILLLIVALGSLLGVPRRKPRLRRSGKARNAALQEPDRFTFLASKAGGRVTAERLVAGGLKRGAATRAEAIERAIARLDHDRRTWR